jgi:hypothetical protein
MKMNHDNTESHFFASSVATWVTTTPERNLKQVLDLMEKEGYPFNLFSVPLPYDADYEIKMYQPQAKGTQWLGFFEGESK